MYCLDTNIIIDIFRGNKKVIKKIQEIWDNEIFVTSITCMELYKGAYGHKNSKEKIKIVDDFLDSVNIVFENIDSVKNFGEIYQKLKKEGKEISDFDCMIASIVKVSNLTIVTQDKHFKNFKCNKLIF